MKTDIWALGMTLYRLLHGKEWYKMQPAPRLVVSDGKFADSLLWLPHIPKKWRRAIRKMLNDDKSQRYETAIDVMNALSKLPTPAWETTVKPSAVRWELRFEDRRRVVEWIEKSPRKHEWTAWSEPISSTGRSKTLGGSGGIVSRSKAIQGLEAFFAA